MKPYRLFILGAGFSRLAGQPLTSELLPLMDCLVRDRHSKSVPLFEKAVKQFFPSTPLDAIDIEELLTLHECDNFVEELRGEIDTSNGSKELVLIRSLVAETLSQYREPLPDAYHEFAAQLNAPDVVITFNWDTLIEEALRSAKRDFTYYSEHNIHCI